MGKTKPELTRAQQSKAARDRLAKRVNCMVAVEQLHALGHSVLHVEDTWIGGDLNHIMRIHIMRGEMGHDQMQALFEWAGLYDAKISLSSKHDNDGVVSRITIWPGDDHAA